MQGIAEFQKVSFEQFLKDSIKCGFIDEEASTDLIRIIWERIKLPKRATGGSGGYDFFLPYPLCLQSTTTAMVPTGIRVNMQPGWVLMLIPRSSLGFKYGLTLINDVALIDSDFYYAENEGHIHAKLETKVNLSLKEGDRFIQGVFVPHGVTRDDKVDEIRTGGFGSTGE